MSNVIFVCTGNICRSPMAEGILRHNWKTGNKNGLLVSSMGIHGLDHKPASQYSQDVCNENGIDISVHRSRGLIASEMEKAYLILCMELVQKNFIRLFIPKFYDKTFLLGAWPEKETRKSAIKDPMGCSLKVYRKVFATINDHIDRILPIIEHEYFH